jgi:hypothetical protein
MNHATRLNILALLVFALPAHAGVCGDAESLLAPSDRILSAFECRNAFETLCVVQGYNGLRSAHYYRVKGHSRYAWPLHAWIDSPTPESAANDGESALSLFHIPPGLIGAPKFRTEMIIQKATGDAVFIVEQNKTGAVGSWETIIHESLRCRLPL